MAQTESKGGSPANPAAAMQDTPPPAGSAAADRVAELEAENKRLREQLAAAGQPAEPARPHTPSFVFSASMVADLETAGRTVSPFDGKRYVGTGRGDAREATVEQFNNAKPPARSDSKSAAGRKR